MMLTKPNVLFLFADQMHAFAMGCMGNRDISTPNLDRLASSGTLFENCYSSNPVCTPYRASLLTGRYSCQTGMIGINDLPVPPGEVCLANLLNKAGYRSSYVGKWHLGDSGNIPVPEEYRCGFTDFIGFQCVNDFLRDVWFFDEQENRRDFHTHRTVAMTDLTLERLAQLKGDPFCMLVSYSNPHYPVQPDREYAEMYWEKELTLRPNFQEIKNPFSPETRRFPRSEDPEHTRRGDDTRSYIKMYYAMVTQLDHEIGRILDYLEETGLMESTMIVFTSDHGDMQGSHGLANKHVHYEESTRVPLIVKIPGTTAHHVSTPVETTDFVPSILDFLNLPSSPMAEGKSFLKMARGDRMPHREAVFVENGYAYYMIRKGRYKMVIDQQTYAPQHLYNLEQDPYEMLDLVDHPELAEVQAGLVRAIIDWHRDVMSRANPKRWIPEDSVAWRTKKAEGGVSREEYASVEFVSKWCFQRRQPKSCLKASRHGQIAKQSIPS